MLKNVSSLLCARRSVRRFAFLLIVGLALSPLVLNGTRAFAQDKPKDPPPANPRVTMIVEGRGTIILELYPKDAPKTVAHFLALVRKKFYDGIKYHRIVPDFVAQAGDPDSKNTDPADFEAKGIGTHGSGETVPLEVKRTHERGTLGLARAQAEDSGDSQFFINLKDNHNLDEGYCSFGKVLKGMDVVDKIAVGDKIKSVREIVPEKPKK